MPSMMDTGRQDDPTIVDGITNYHAIRLLLPLQQDPKTKNQQSKGRSHEKKQQEREEAMAHSTMELVGKVHEAVGRYDQTWFLWKYILEAYCQHLGISSIIVFRYCFYMLMWSSFHRFYEVHIPHDPRVFR